MSDSSSPFKLKAKINPPVFYSATLLVFLIVVSAVLMPEKFNKLSTDMQASIVTNVSWFYVAAVAIILMTVAYLGISRLGDIKLGPDHSAPDFSNGSWFAMLFSAGMGIGLMFFGVAEPVMHYLSPPTGDPGSVEAAREAMKLTFFHWGLHAWGIYAMVALILAYFGYRHGLPLTLRSALYPLIGDKIYGPIGHAVDVFAILGTVFGVATSLGYGVLQVNSGLNYLFALPVNETVQVVLIVVISGLAAISVATGLDKGIRILSEINLLLAVALVGLVLLLGPTVLLLQMFLQNTGGYLSDIVNKTFNLFAYQPTDWLGGWTLLYWGWWLSWSPFVGMFIARISRGRTIREFVIGVLFVPTGFTFLWMTVFGNTSIDMMLQGTGDELAAVVNQDVSLALFKFLEAFPMSSFLSVIAIIMVVVFFVTSSDSGSMVVDMLASGGTDKTPVWQRVFWASMEGVVAIALLLAGGLGALQTATIASALPFCIVLLISAYGLLKALRIDATKRVSLDQVIHPPRVDSSLVGWERRLKNLVLLPRRKNVGQFIADVVIPAMESVATELEKHSVDTRFAVDEDSLSARFEVFHGDEQDFLYRVRPKAYLQPSFLVEEDDDEARKYFRAEVFLLEGGQDYDIMGWSKEQVISDMIDQYEKHMHFLHQVR
ncbi:high-affinity choline transporter BetT [Corallincola holothuriorum]|uniref:High-affinity choline transporter BetT n=1 Tax=Corallincola holothuriorum TaxID=2282215 RepID=A0A368NH88_9GAMM|nr:choline BCCT transporter BetT [Corallincola holothuriorum]RCU49932.1 high-affinity choline transporter BetT [Corallincola holothuriorum]